MTTDVRWADLTPQLEVRDVRAAQAWYRDMLGLGIHWTWLDGFGSVGKDEVQLFFIRDPEPQPSTCCVFVDDVDAVYERVRERGGEVVDDLEEKPWNVREFTLRDPDGNRFRITQPVENPVPRPEFSFPQEAR